MKKLFSVLLIVCIAFVITACGENEEQTEQETITIHLSGSTSVDVAITAALNAFKSEVSNFEYVKNLTGSGDGHRRTLGSEKDHNPAHIGFASRAFSANEVRTNAMSSGTFALDAIAVIVHKNHTATNLTQEQILKIYTGQITNWSEIDPSLSGTINVYSRDSNSGARGAFQEIIGFSNDELTTSATITASNGDLATRVGNDERGIGYVSLSTDFEANNVKAVQYNGVNASIENIVNVQYTLSRPFNYTTRASNDYASDAERDMVKAFIAYLGTKDGMAVMAATGVGVDSSNAPTWAEIRSQHPIVN